MECVFKVGSSYWMWEDVGGVFKVEAVIGCGGTTEESVSGCLMNNDGGVGWWMYYVE